MPRCPQCNKNLVELTPRCPTCQADLGLLLDYVGQLQSGLERADNLTRNGELGQAVWAYLEVLEVDPDNPTARRQVGQVATAVRQFDVTAPGRRWGLGWNSYLNSPLVRWLAGAALAVLLIIVFSLGYFLGSLPGGDTPDVKPPPTNPDSATGR